MRRLLPVLLALALAEAAAFPRKAARPPTAFKEIFELQKSLNA